MASKTFWTETVSVYLIHLDSKLSHAQHYIGSALDVEKRLAEHAAGQGSKMMAAVVTAGIGFRLARTWANVPRWFEAQLHRAKATPQLCPVCAGEGALRRGQFGTKRGGRNNG